MELSDKARTPYLCRFLFFFIKKSLFVCEGFFAFVNKGTSCAQNSLNSAHYQGSG